jgi:hypothetical protein
MWQGRPTGTLYIGMGSKAKKAKQLAFLTLFTLATPKNDL